MKHYFSLFILLSLCLLSINLQAQSELFVSEIEEVSGVCYSPETNTVFACTDEGEVFQISLTGELLQRQYIGDYDFEGITLFSNNVLIVVAEEENQLVFMDTHLNVRYVYNLPESLLLTEDGVEGMTVHDGEVFMTFQSDVTDELVDINFVSKLFVLSGFESDSLYMSATISMPVVDLAGLDSYNGFLYVVSDDANLLLKMDASTNTIIEEYELPGEDQEGIAFDQDGNVYIAQDSAGILKISFNDLSKL